MENDGRNDDRYDVTYSEDFDVASELAEVGRLAALTALELNLDGSRM